MLGLEICEKPELSSLGSALLKELLEAANEMGRVWEREERIFSSSEMRATAWGWYRKRCSFVREE